MYSMRILLPLTQQAFLCVNLLHTGLFELGTDFFEGNSIIAFSITFNILFRRRRLHSRFRTGIAWPFHIVDIVMRCAVLCCVVPFDALRCILSFFVSSCEVSN